MVFYKKKFISLLHLRKIVEQLGEVGGVYRCRVGLLPSFEVVNDTSGQVIHVFQKLMSNDLNWPVIEHPSQRLAQVRKHTLVGNWCLAGDNF